MKMFLIGVVAFMIAVPTIAGNTVYRDVDVSWKTLGSNHAERTATAKAMSAQNVAYAKASEAAKEAAKNGDYALCESKNLEAGGLALWSWVAAWKYNNAAYAIILAFEAEEMTKRALARARKHLKKALSQIEAAKTCDICREQIDNWDEKAQKAEDTILKNQDYIDQKLGSEVSYEERLEQDIQAHRLKFDAEHKEEIAKLSSNKELDRLLELYSVFE